MKSIIKNKAVAYLIVLLIIFASSVIGTITITETGFVTDTTLMFHGDYDFESGASFSLMDKITTSDGLIYNASNTNLQTAIDSLTNGGTVWIPGNTTISISTVIDMGNNINLIGMGVSTILYLANGANCDIIDITSKENIHIEKIKFDGNNASNTDNPLIDIQSAGVGGADTRNITIRDCYFYNCGTSMVDVHYDDNTWWLKVEDCYFNGIERDIGQYPAGIWFSGFNAILKNNWIEDTFACGIVIEAASDELMASNIVIDGNFVTGYTGYGILVEGGGDTANITIVNNHCWDLWSVAYFSAEAENGAYSTGIRCTGNSTIANNWVNNVHRHGIYADGNYIIITGNVVEDVYWKEGIQISGSGICANNIIRNIQGVGGAGRGIRACNEWFSNPHFVIIGNFIEGTDAAGIHIDAGEGTGNINHCTVSNNIILTSAVDGIILTDVENSSFIGNVFDDYGSLAIDEDSDCYNNTFIGNVASDAGNDYDFDGGGSAVGVEIIANVGQIA